ncbi:MAG TPA: circadian clock KaiB family protein [Verrucomicrobiae bacterium]|nr:circadian clock KaiB family protein [Verrucomicrobiae bacterium]
MKKPHPDKNAGAQLEALAARRPDEHYRLRLYVTGATPRSLRAIENLKRLCESRLAGRYELEVVDIYQQPQLARDDQIVAAPTLIKLLPQPLRRLIGDLADSQHVLFGLDLAPLPRAH